MERFLQRNRKPFGLLLMLLLASQSSLAQNPDFKETKAQAEAGDAEAQFNLALMYDVGIGVPQNYAESGKWYRQAAERGVPEAQFELGVRYFKYGSSAKENYSAALRFFRKAADQGLAVAQFNLGIMYETGLGVPTNKVESYRWYNLAAAQGMLNALEARELLAGQMSREEVADGQRRAAAFKPERVFARRNRLLVDPSASPRANGSGFFITEDGYLLTSYHVVKEADKIVVKTKQGSFTASLVKADNSNDIAILKVSGSFHPLPLAASQDVKLGEPVLTIGFPNTDVQGEEPKLTRGEISSLAGMQDDQRHFQISVPVQPGNSGGMLVNKYGNVVGIVRARLSDLAALRLTGAIPQNVNYAVKSELAAALLNTVPGVAARLKPAHATEDRKFEEVVKEAEAGAALVLVY